MDPVLIQKAFVVTLAVVLLVFLVVRWKLPAFFALLLVSVVAGLGLGLEPQALLDAIRTGMGGTLGFIAIVVGLGALLGALLEAAGGVQTIAGALLKHGGERHTPWLLSIIGFLVAIPVFFDVGLIILMPMIYGLARRSGKQIVYYALPLAAGLAAAHAFVPPTPGPVAVADLLKADLGWVILFGIMTAAPAALIGGALFASVAFNGISTHSQNPVAETPKSQEARAALLSLPYALGAILLPLFLIVGAAIAENALSAGAIRETIIFLGHPFTALMIALMLLYALLRGTRALGAETLHTAMGKALEPTAAIILVTGAGGAFKQVLTASGAGADIAGAAAAISISPLLFGFAAAAIVRIMQGSATVAMITSAGFTAPLIEAAALSAPQTALVVIAVAAGATAFSHVNDSGFWLINRYLGQSAAQTLKSWSLSSTLIGLSGLLMALALSFFVA